MTKTPTGLPTDTPPDGTYTYTDFKTKGLYWLLMQGLGVVVLAVWLYTQWLDNKQFRAEARDCQSEMIQIQTEQNAKLIEALNNLNEQLEDLKKDH